MIQRFFALNLFQRLLAVSAVVLSAAVCSIIWVDLPVAEYMRSLKPETRALAEPVTTVGKAEWPLISLALLIGFFCLRRRWQLANRTALAFTAICATLIVHLFKLGFGRARPSQYFKDDPVYGFGFFRVLTEGGKYSHYASFPSGHSAVAGALAVSSWLVAPNWLRWPIVVLSVMIAASRVVLTSHWVADTLAGFLLGAVLAVLLHRLFMRWHLLEDRPWFSRGKPPEAEG